MKNFWYGFGLGMLFTATVNSIIKSKKKRMSKIVIIV
jgi:hypothetical protein